MTEQAQPMVATTPENPSVPLVAPKSEPSIAPVVAQPKPTEPEMTLEEMREQTQQLLTEKRAANAEAKTRRLHEKELEDTLAKYKAAEEEKRKAEMTELERVKAESQKYQAELVAERAERERTAREYEVSSAGVLRKYAKFVAAELATAKPEDVTEWLDAFKLENPAFFAQPKVIEKIVEKIVVAPIAEKPAISQAPAPAAGGGGPPPPASTPDVQNQIQALVDRYKTLTTGTAIYQDGAGTERTLIKREYKRLTGRELKV